ncbi:probable protein phosphatase 2C 55 [Capsicum annuum]|uniref:probable protein phosphatase 2C 55 n=1 Tax=Capsicum annuum TaxID=4072 RepID=UPI0007BF55A1|nr:probable protein phosphatase 2C 55 [Capsicum annuum]
MRNALIATNNEPKGHVNPKRVPQEAYKNKNHEGSSTTCIITLNCKKNTICAANVNDSRFFLFRKGKIIYKSPIQQWSLGCPYQLGKCNDNPNVAHEMELNIKKDDILIVGTDGMLDNMNESDIEEIVQRAIDHKLKADGLARKIGNVALFNSLDRFADTPFARASKRKGGKVGDITVIVAYFQ